MLLERIFSRDHSPIVQKLWTKNARIMEALHNSLSGFSTEWYKEALTFVEALGVVATCFKESHCFKNKET